MAEEKEKDLIQYETEKGEVQLSPGIVKRYLDPSGKVSREEAVLFMQLCKFHRLNPFLREAYIVKYSDKQPASLVVGKETFTKRAEKHGAFDGMKAGVYVKGAKLEKRVGSLVLEGEEVVGGWAEVWRTDQEQSVESSVTFREYAVTKADGTLNRMWATKPATMIRKVALVQALREAFPDSFQGMYVEEEMESTKPEDFTMPSEVEKRVGESFDKAAKVFHDAAEKAEDAETSELDAAADAGWDAAESGSVEPPEPTKPVDAEGTFSQIFAILNTWGKGKASKIFPYAKRAREAQDNEEELQKILEEVKEL